MGKLDDILREINVSTNKGENSLLNNLLKTPVKEKTKTMAHTTASKIWAREQIDTLYLPNDEGYKYLLVVVDIATRKADAEPMKTRDSNTTVKALTKIFKRGIVKQPITIEVDDGTEFKGEFSKHFKRILNVLVKVSGRHRQQSVVETKNQQIQKVLNARMTAEEINNDDTSRSWVDIVPDVIKAINKHYAYPAVLADPDAPIRGNNKTKEVIPEGTKVRIKLDNPVDYVEGKRLHGKFRTGDIRWSRKVSIITQFYLRPDQPVMYQIDNDSRVAYTHEQLQIVKDNEVKPNPKGQKQFYAVKIIDKKKIKGLVNYVVLWEDGDKTLMDREQVLKEIPDLLKEFNKK
jgi:hypothetical protein